MAKDLFSLFLVEQATVFHEENNMTYKMSSSPRGFALIVDNEEYDSLPPRRGSHVDSQCLTQVRHSLTSRSIGQIFKICSKLRNLYQLLRLGKLIISYITVQIQGIFSKNSRKFATSPSPELGCHWLYKKLPANRRDCTLALR